ncbi:SDR family NAD(P)-dependent oxidoreductase [Streptomyces sp. NPDC058045]|uniref:SDR family NAD(P)-dependent oxidoreductase n=1 Tax=Streptomyces sp. NPDC058045 TaxID=3346311 RepID=UPI0036E457ED
MQSAPTGPQNRAADDPAADAGELAGRVIIVSGAGSGMGQDVAIQAARCGASVLAVDRDESGLRALADRAAITSMAIDLTAPGAPETVVQECLTTLGSPRGLVSAAGVFQTRAMLDVTPEDFDLVFSVNVRALFFLQQAVAAAMTAGGSIVNFASTAARVPRPVSSHYAASKAAVVSLSRSASVAWAERGIRVNTICPGVISTPMIDAILEEQSSLAGITPAELEDRWCAQNPMGRLGRTGEVADLVTFLLSNRSAYITGETIGINGGADDI